MGLPLAFGTPTNENGFDSMRLIICTSNAQYNEEKEEEKEKQKRRRRHTHIVIQYRPDKHEFPRRVIFQHFRLRLINVSKLRHLPDKKRKAEQMWYYQTPLDNIVVDSSFTLSNSWFFFHKKCWRTTLSAMRRRALTESSWPSPTFNRMFISSPACELRRYVQHHLESGNHSNHGNCHHHHHHHHHRRRRHRHHHRYHHYHQYHHHYRPDSANQWAKSNSNAPASAQAVVRLMTKSQQLRSPDRHSPPVEEEDCKLTSTAERCHVGTAELRWT